jgi:DNA-binding MarR family transcriptional regulator
LLRCPRGCQVRHPVLRSVLGTDRPAHDSISILAKLKRKGPLTINALAEDMVMDRTTLARNILPLERDGLIRIEATASDRRAKELHLTKAGEKRLQAALKGWSQAQARFETVFGAKRAADLRVLLRAAAVSEFVPQRGSIP